MSELHAMQFLLELLDFWLADIGIEGFLHLLFELVLALPEKDLSFALYDLIYEFCLFFTDDIDVEFQFGGLVFHLFQFLYELAFQVYVLVL
jgi:hypothetical protein